MSTITDSKDRELRFSVYIQGMTWFRDTHGIFDYDAYRYIESEILP